MGGEDMKQLLLIALVGLFCVGIAVIRADGSLSKSNGEINIKFLKAKTSYNYGPRGKISASNGDELFPAYPPTFTESNPESQPYLSAATNRL